MKKQSKFIEQTCLALAVSFFSGVAFADEIATEQIGGSYLSLSPLVTYDNAYLNIGGISSAFEAGESINVELSGLEDGIYYYQLTLATASAEDDATAQGGESLTEQSGQLRIVSGEASAFNDDIADAEAAVENNLNDSLASTEDLPANNDDL